MKFATAVKRTIDVAKYRRPVGDDHGNDQILDRRDRKRLQVAAAQCRLIEADQKTNQQDRERDVGDGRNDAGAIDPSHAPCSGAAENKTRLMRSLLKHLAARCCAASMYERR